MQSNTMVPDTHTHTYTLRFWGCTLLAPPLSQILTHMCMPLLCVVRICLSVVAKVEEVMYDCVVRGLGSSKSTTATNEDAKAPADAVTPMQQ